VESYLRWSNILGEYKWLLLLFSFVLAFTHYRVILGEEKKLDEQFGNKYQEYCEKVRRYF